jgi:hypothetical protein
MIMTMGGTIICVAPTNQSMVICADSRQMMDNTHFQDNVQKIRGLENRMDLAFAMLGQRDLYWDPTDGQEINEWVKNAAVKFEAAEVMGAFLESHAPLEIDRDFVEELARHCKSKLEDVLAQNEVLRLQYSNGARFFQGVIVQYRRETKTGIVGFFQVGNIPNGEINARVLLFSKFAQDKSGSGCVFGAQSYLSHPAFWLLAPSGHLELRERLKASLVRDVNQDDAMQLANEMVATAIKVAEQTAVSPTVGGRIYSCVIDGLSLHAGLAVIGRAKHPEEPLRQLTERFNHDG